jgi:hypothetical protein
MRARITAYAAGAGLIGTGLIGLLTHAADTRPTAWVRWFVGAALAHDLVLVPAVLLVGALIVRLPDSYRRPVRAGLTVAGCAVLVVLPALLGFGRSADNPSALPLPYGRNLLGVLAGSALVTIAWCAVNRQHSRRRRRLRASPVGQGEPLDGQSDQRLSGEPPTGGQAV